MGCFVHLESNPEPKAIENAEVAFQFAENHLKQDDDEDESLWTVKWRRDDLYPDNFYSYTYNELNSELSSKGSVVLQIVKEQPDGNTLLGETARIFTADIEKKLQDEAELALEKTAEIIEIHGEGLSSRKRNITSRKKNK